MEKKKLINVNLISLKCVLFIFFGGLGCLVPFLPLHMLATGLTLQEARIVSIVAPLTSLLGPLVVGPLADKLAGSKSGAFGRHLRIITAVTLLLGALFYSLLLAVPTVVRLQARRPSVSFTCDAEGAVILQERCTEEKTCYHWTEDKAGSLLLSNCRYSCERPDALPSAGRGPGESTPLPVDKESSADVDYDYGDDKDPDYVEPETSVDKQNERRKRQSSQNPVFSPGVTPFGISREPPHLCHTPAKDGSPALCQVYTEDTKRLSVTVTLQGATNDEDDFGAQNTTLDDVHSEEWCRYPLGGYFRCHVPHDHATWMALVENSTACDPVVECDVDEPYDSPDSVLADSQCLQVIGNPSLTFWSYLVIRCIADMFPVAAVSLLGAAIVIATRETSTGRGDVGVQLAWASFGWSLFAPLVGYLENLGDPSKLYYLIPIVVYISMMVLGGLVLLFASGMPLTPPEWWWHTRCGMLALPMSAVRRYGPETAALSVALLLLGACWSALDTYQPWHLREFNGSDLLLGLTLTVGALPAIPLLWYAERLVDYCGHSNLLIVSFTIYILRFTGMALVDEPWWTLLLEAMEPLTLGLTWVTAVLYMRHLMPRRLTATGQALPVIAHFCLGRCLGALIGGLVQVGSTLDSLRALYKGMAIACAVIAIVYFLLYHFLLAPKCAAQPIPPPPPSVLQAINGGGAGTGNSNGTGNYTPLRVYHDGKGRKGQFRY